MKLSICFVLMMAVGTVFGGTWQDAMQATGPKVAAAKGRHAKRQIQNLYQELNKQFPVECDWFAQGTMGIVHGVTAHFAEFFNQGRKDSRLEVKLIDKAIESSGAAGQKYIKKLAALKSAKTPPRDKRWLALFIAVCTDRRAARLKTLSKKVPQIAFIKRYPVRPSFYAYTEGLSDAQAERHFTRNGKLCLMKISEAGCKVEDLLVDMNGVIRDLDVSYDGKRMLFAWKKDDKKDDYHLYEMTVATKKIRQLTSGLGKADYEGIYLPDGDIMFSSSRCVQTVDCWWTEVSNMYKCDKDGKYMRRIGFDQVHTVHPAVMNNGTIVYTRWDYNDRGQVYPQPLFQMNPDGTGQTEYYGNNSYFPTTIDHAAPIPGSNKIVVVLHGHHTPQMGELAIIDRTKGTQEASGVQLIAPVRKTVARREDRYGQRGDLFRHPYALSETEFIVSMMPKGGRKFGLYWIHADGNRELLTFDAAISCNHPKALQPRKRPHVKPSTVDYTKTTGTYFMQDVYVGPGLKGIHRGAIKELRVVALEFRAAGVGSNRNSGEAGGALVSTPISYPNGTWDVKKILGTTKVHADGSAMFEVPANTPVYFQAINAKGEVVQTMRSWSTLMPGETFGCVGCHEDKLSVPMKRKATMALKAGVQKLKPFHGPARGFSFIKEIQPILDKHCIKCHKLEPKQPKPAGKRLAFSLKGNTPKRRGSGGRNWSMSYNNLLSRRGKNSKPLVNWITSQSRPNMLPPYHKGSATSPMIALLRKGHGKTKLSKEDMDKLCAWIDLGVPFCGDYMEANSWDKRGMAKYLRYQRKREGIATEIRRNTESLIQKLTGKAFKIADPKPRYTEYEAALNKNKRR